MLTNQQPDNGILEEFRLEFLDYWRRVPDKGFFFGLLVLWLALFQFVGNSTLGYLHTPSLLKWMYGAYQATLYEDGHGTAVPFIVLGILWWKRKALIKVPFRTWSPGLLLIGAGLFFHLVGYVVQQPRISIVGLFTGIYGIMGLVWGWRFLKATFFPYCLFVFCVPLGSLAEPITFRLRLLVCQLVEAVSHYILQADIIREGTALKDPTGRYQYEVAAACSGIRSLISTIGLAIIYGTLVFPTWWKRAVVFASAFPLAILGNMLRMLTIVVASELAPVFGGNGQAWGNYAHESAVFSVLPYVPVFVGLFALGHWLGDKRKPETVLRAAPQPT